MGNKATQAERIFFTKCWPPDLKCGWEPSHVRCPECQGIAWYHPLAPNHQHYTCPNPSCLRRTLLFSFSEEPNRQAVPEQNFDKNI